MNDRAFSLSFFRAFTHYELFVISVLKINRINPLLDILSSKLAAITNVMHELLGVGDYFKRQLKTIRFPISRAPI